MRNNKKSKKKNGMTYYNNYDFVLKWLSATFKDKTLDVIGIKTAPILRVTGYEPTEIAVKAGRIDVLFEDKNGMYYHLEEERNITRSDFYRFAAYHFGTAKEYGDNIKDIILISGKPYKGSSIITTKSGKYDPIIVDFTKKDGEKRLEEIKREIENNNMDILPELVFLPLYGTLDKKERSVFVKKIIRYEIKLKNKGIMDENLIAATFTMCNKFLNKTSMKTLWKEVKMIKIIKFAHDKGEKKGLKKGLEEGEKKGEKRGSQNMLIDLLYECFTSLPEAIIESIGNIKNQKTLSGLQRAAVRSNGDFNKFDTFFRQTVMC